MRERFWGDGYARFLSVTFGGFFALVLGMTGWYFAGFTSATVTIAEVSASCGTWRADCVVTTTDARIFNVYDESWVVMKPGGTYTVVEHLHTTANYPSLGQAKPA